MTPGYEMLEYEHDGELRVECLYISQRQTICTQMIHYLTTHAHHLSLVESYVKLVAGAKSR